LLYRVFEGEKLPVEWGGVYLRLAENCELSAKQTEIKKGCD